jgi:VWFA-related protein
VSALPAPIGKVLATAALVASWWYVPSVATQQTQVPRPAFTSSVDLVSVDVNVIDRNGRPVRDLAASDFTLTVDGRERKIASAQFVSVTAPADSPQPPPADYSTNVGAAAGRLIVLVVDRGSIAPVRAKDVLNAAARFVSRLGPSDRVALFSIPSGPAIDFTTEHDAVVSALQRTDGQADRGPGTKNIGVADALAFERRNGVTIEEVVARECGSMGATGAGAGAGGLSDQMLCRKLVVEEANIIAAYAHERARDTIAGLRNILERLGSGETPKTIVLVSEALVIDGDRYATAGLARAVAAAHATIYALKPEPSDSDASHARAPQGRARDRAVREEGLIAVTRAGGGELFRVVADPDFAFDRLAAELSGYYLLGFEPDEGDRDGKPHTITVTVRRHGVAVRSRTEFSVGAASRRTDEQVITDLLRTSVVATDLPVRLTTYAFQDPDSPKIRLLVAMEVDRPADPNGHLALGIVLVKPGGEIGASLFQPAIQAPSEPTAEPQRSFATLLVDPGPYVLRAAVVDGGGRRGSLERPVRAFMTRMSRFRATELLIGDKGDTGTEPAAGSVVPTVSGDLSGDQLHTYLELFADSPAGFDGVTVTIDVLSADGSAVVDSAPASLQPTGTDERCRAVAGAVPIALLPTGSYVARAVVSLDGRKVGQMTRPFRVVKP